ncbi:MAG: MFS transporter [Proteobacteria bacterium]|nr:MFS transporter [Pseudomonadota bacterium]
MIDRLVMRNVWVSSWVLSLSLFGDALIYVILPVHADAFGVSMVMVGFLLAVNRIIRTFAYGLIVDLAERIGVKNLCLIAAITATLSTAGYGFLDGAVLLTLSRMLWGLSFAALLLVTLTYAAVNPAKTGTRIGISRSVEQVGPLFAMTVGAWFATIVGPRDVFLYLGLATAVCVGLAFSLDGSAQPERIKKPLSRDRIFPRPDSLDMMIFWMGAGIDGVFTVSISIMWAQYVSLETAILFGGSILAARRLSEMLMAPCSGLIADRFGIRLPLTLMILVTIAGFALIGAGQLLAGSVALVLARGALGTLFPAAVARINPENKVKALARNQTWRDVGAAAGPLATGAGLAFVAPEIMHIIVAAAFIIAFAVFVLSPGWKTVTRPVI